MILNFDAFRFPEETHKLLTALQRTASSALNGSTVEKNGTVSLSTLREGRRARIVALRGATSFDMRLLELGFVPGSLVLVRRNSPLRDPVEFEVRNSRICLRRSEAERILVVEVAS